MDYRIIENAILARFARITLKSGNVAMVLGKTIHLSGVNKAVFLSNPKWLAHELIHINQFKKYGFFPFLYYYLIESIKNGYYHNRFEIEAREGARNVKGMK